MSFERDFKRLRTRLHVSGVPPAALVCLAVVAAALLLFASANVFGAFRSAELMVAKADGGVLDSAEASVSVEGASEGADRGDEAGAHAVVTVHVGGAVVAPGVYELSEGSRVQDAVDAAGGFSADADVDSVNRARVLSDGEQVIIARTVPEGQQGDVPSASATADDGRVDVNAADVEELDRLKGVGPATAEAIVAYREENGPFSKVEDLLEVPGIGEAKLEGMRDQVRL